MSTEIWCKIRYDEIAIIKAMVRSGRFSNEQILPYFTRPDRTVNPARIYEIKKGTDETGVNPASEKELEEFLKNWTPANRQQLEIAITENRKDAADIINSKRDFIQENLDLKADIIALKRRKEQLDLFDKLLKCDDFFNTEKERKGGSEEEVWQNFFENNTWIFGYALTLVGLRPLDDKRLEQYIKGPSIYGPGKRVDGITRTRGALSLLCVVEIKTHRTHLLSSKPYRKEAFPASHDLVGGVAQVQSYIEALEREKQKIEINDDKGNPKGDSVYAYKPRSFLVIGRLDEFNTEHGPNMPKLQSFQLFRRNIAQPEIVTFDELFYRAKGLVEALEHTDKPLT